MSRYQHHRDSGRRGRFTLVGAHDDSGDLRYAGHVACGFSERCHVELAQRLMSIARPVSPFSDYDAGDVHWVQPILVGEVAHQAGIVTLMTATGVLG